MTKTNRQKYLRARIVGSGLAHIGREFHDRGFDGELDRNDETSGCSPGTPDGGLDYVGDGGDGADCLRRIVALAGTDSCLTLAGLFGFGDRCSQGQIRSRSSRSRDRRKDSRVR